MTDEVAPPLPEAAPAAAEPAPPVFEAAPAIVAIAMIDDGLRPMRVELFPENERDAVLKVLADAEVLEDLAIRGMDAGAVAAQPDDAIEILTDPAVDNGMAYAKISDVSAGAIAIIDRRRMMRQIAAAVRIEGGCEVVELGPEADLADIARFDVVFIDYFLDDKEMDGTIAERIAGEVQDRRDATRRQQIVLMSSRAGVRAIRTEFRKTASIEAASFAFVDKADLDEAWKVKAHLEMLARGMQHSGALGDYISAVKTKAKEAAESLARRIDDLDIGDFAYIQRIALHADGHPLGDYLSWLLSSHLTALAFEGALREQQAAVDSMEFEDGPLSPAEPSTELAALYHDALFARNLGALGGHPRAGEGSDIADVPFVQLGDVFLTPDKAHAVVVLSPDCDLAFSTDPTRKPDRNLGVILMFGDPNSVASDADKDTSTTTEGMLDGAEVYRIDWRFNSFRTVRLAELAGFLKEEGFDLSKRDRLRPIYSLKLQHELGNHLMRVGPPVMPPIASHLRSKIRYSLGEKVVNVDLDTTEVVVSRFKKKSMVRFTPSLVAKLKRASADLLEHLTAQLAAMPTEGDEAQKALKAMAAKVDGLRGQLEGSQVWSSLIGDQPLMAPGESKKLKGSVHLAHGAGWAFPQQPAVVLVVGDQPDPGPGEGDGGEATETADPGASVGRRMGAAMGMAVPDAVAAPVRPAVTGAAFGTDPPPPGSQGKGRKNL
jgi:hypothetical protein